MSAVTAGIIVGTRHRSDPGIQPRWIVLLHEGQNYAWHLMRLQLTAGDSSGGPDDPPGVLWRAAPDGDLLGELSLLLHLYAARTPEIVEAVRRCPSLRKHRLDLGELEGAELGDYENALRLARESGRELLLAVTIMRESRLTEEALLELPGWELNISHTALSRDWDRVDNGLVVTDYREEVYGDLEVAETSVEEFDAFGDEPSEAADRADSAQGANPGRAPVSPSVVWAAQAQAQDASELRAAAAPPGEPGQDGEHGEHGQDGGPGREHGPATRPDPTQDPASSRRGRLRWHTRPRRPVIQETERPRISLAEFFGREED